MHTNTLTFVLKSKKEIRIHKQIKPYGPSLSLCVWVCSPMFLISRKPKTTIKSSCNLIYEPERKSKIERVWWIFRYQKLINTCMVAAVLFAASFPSLPHRQPIIYAYSSSLPLSASSSSFFFPFRSISQCLKSSLVFSYTYKALLDCHRFFAAADVTIAFCCSLY